MNLNNPNNIYNNYSDLWNYSIHNYIGQKKMMIYIFF